MSILDKKNIIKKITLLCWIFFAANIIVLAQESRIIKGTIKDKTDNSLVPGATVVEVDKNNRIISGTISDINGQYAIKLKNPQNRISFGFIGYKTQIITPGEKLILDIFLVPDNKMLNSVDIVSKKRVGTDGISNVSIRDMGVPIVSIDAKEFEDLSVNSVDDALQGRLTGVDITSNGGDPGAGMSIKIRGTSTLNANSEPLIVVDNVPYNMEIRDDFDFANEDEQGYADLLNIAPEDIAEISVLKDASATAMWGAKAVNGVLLIKTKRGQRKKPTLTYSHMSTVTWEPQSLPMLNGDQYSTLILEGYENGYGYPLVTAVNKEFLYDPSDPWWYYNYSNNTDWWDETHKNSYQQTHALSLNGGGEKAQYRFSLNYKDQGGTTLGAGYEGLTGRMNLDYSISEKLKVRMDLSYSNNTTNKNYDYRNFSKRTLLKMPNMSVFEYDSDGTLTSNYLSPESNIQGSYGSTYNPVALAKEGIYDEYVEQLISVFKLDYNILSSLYLSGLVSYKTKNTVTSRFLPETATGVAWTDTDSNYSYEKSDDYNELYTETKLIYSPELPGKHKAGATLQWTTYEGRNIYNAGSSLNSASVNLQDVSNGSTNVNLSAANNYGDSKSVGGTALLHYKYADRYIITGTVRREGNSKLSKEQRWATFKSLSLSYRVSDEPFMEKYDWLDELRVSTSIGENGNLPRYENLYYNDYASYNWTYLNKTGVFPSSMELGDLTWEQVISKNLRFDLSMFKNRVNVNADLYMTNTNGALVTSASIPSTTGYNSIYMNVADLESKGWEIAVNLTPVQTNNWRVGVNFNISRNSNILKDAKANYSLTSGSVVGNGSYLTMSKIGNPIGSFYGYRSQGVYSTTEETIATDANGAQIFDATGKPVYMVFNYPDNGYQFVAGDAKYEDVNHDGNINYMDVVYLGNINPDFYGGFGASVTFKKNLSLSVFFNYRYGNEIMNMTRMDLENMYSYNNQSTAVLRRWRNEGDVTDIPRATIKHGYNYLGSDRFVEDGSFVRFKYLTLRYDIPKTICQQLKVTNMKLSTTINNLQCYTKYLGMNPDISVAKYGGKDTGITPISTGMTFNLSVTF
ncbi:SusC/RagA family TonB-linked outer membrane protein [Plebeiibacterium sediminum]|uniref:SusC/RagA family TonB-linked outer membrane protein n=1 Tax=Plebeiibacterium sediminum TaxID=2992112 RepID=A0AAE3M5G0_9BACT|nr:SusC/RagA family TonB-linked outer membrane protein [Plebeiobacterium sediminum]MCW3787000.1 SusC/RagA family TonB-linked outer membrane protein [Plebeiobacterium sediminum]